MGSKKNVAVRSFSGLILRIRSAVKTDDELGSAILGEPLCRTFPFTHFHLEGHAFGTQIFELLRIAGEYRCKFLKEFFNFCSTDSFNKNSENLIRFMIIAIIVK